MRVICFTMLIGLSASAFGQNPGSEVVTVEGSRIPTTPFGPVAWGSGPGREPGSGCADPTCGGAIDKPEPGVGSDSTTQADKDKQNKESTEKAKSAGDRMREAIKNSMDLVSLIKKWMKGISVEVGLEAYHETYYPDGRVDKGGWCAHYHAKLATDDPNYKNPCIESKADPQVVKKNNGTYENQLQLSYVMYDTCYWERKCGPKYYTWIAGSEDELNRLLNTVVGEAVYY